MMNLSFKRPKIGHSSDERRRSRSREHVSRHSPLLVLVCFLFSLVPAPHGADPHLTPTTLSTSSREGVARIFVAHKDSTTRSTTKAVPVVSDHASPVGNSLISDETAPTPQQIRSLIKSAPKNESSPLKDEYSINVDSFVSAESNPYLTHDYYEYEQGQKDIFVKGRLRKKFGKI